MKKKLVTWLFNYLQRPSNWKVGDKFTVVEWIHHNDRSWIGDECEITEMHSNLIHFKTLSGFKVTVNYRWYAIGEDFTIRPL